MTQMQDVPPSAARTRDVSTQTENNAIDIFGKVFVVTTAAHGIGAACAKKIVTNGGRVVIADVNDKEGLALAHELGSEVAAFQHCNLTQEDDVVALMELAVNKFGSLDCVVSIAGLMQPVADANMSKTNTSTSSEFDVILNINSRGVFLGMLHGARVMRRLGVKGSIVNMGSTVGVHDIDCNLEDPSYQASKTAVIGMTKVGAASMQADGIRVNCVSPSLNDTMAAATIVADVVLMLCSPAGAAINGTNIPVNQGKAPRGITC